MSNRWSDTGRWRQDGLTVLPLPGLANRWLILPSDDQQPLTDECPCCRQPITTIEHAREAADEFYPLAR